MINRRSHSRGFTFIEVLIAMLIFVTMVVIASDVTRGAVRTTRESKEITIATWLLQNVMVELETKLETQGIDKGCDKKKDGKFDPPYEKYTWITYCGEIDMKLSETAAQVAKAAGNDEKSDEQRTHEDQIEKMVLELASTYITKALRELHAEVWWVQGKVKRKVDLTTHFVRYDQPLTLPGLGGTTGGTGAPPPPTH